MTTKVMFKGKDTETQKEIKLKYNKKTEEE